MILGKPRPSAAKDAATGPQANDPDGSPLTFVEFLEQMRRRWGAGKTAFQHKVRRDWHVYTHQDVYDGSYAAASGFAALGLQHGDRVAIILENGPEWMLSYYGTVLNGAIGVPIYYDLKPSEIRSMVEHAEPKLAVVSAKVLPRIEAQLSSVQTIIVVGNGQTVRDGAPSSFMRKARPEIMRFDDLASLATPETRKQVANANVQPDDIASIVFTSGTSGGAKGVMLTHRNFMVNSRGVLQSIPFNEHDRLVMVLPLHHAFPFLVTIAVAPTIGGEVTFENDLRRIRDRMAEVKPTLFLGVPALFELMYRNIVHGIEVQGRLETFQRGLRVVEATKQRTGVNIGRIVFRELHKRLGGSLRFMVSGGAALNPQVARDFAMLGVPIIQGWGLSEAAPVLTAQRWYPRKFYMSNYYEERFGSIGQAIDGAEVGLIDVPEKELYVHLHGEGELVARGENITPGYWRAPEESSAIKVGEWLRTGDLGRIDDEGNVWITGRSKFIIVLESGEKIHPDDVEEKIELSPVIQDIVVMGRKMRGKTQINAVIYPNRDNVLAMLGDEPATQESVRRLVAEAITKAEADIALYKRVADFMLTDEPLPRTPIRKVMRGSIAESYSFDPRRWEQSWREFLEATGAPTSDAGDDDLDAAAS